MKIDPVQIKTINGLIHGERPPDALWYAFTWENTEEGQQYWLDASNQDELSVENIAKLRQLRDDAEIANV